MENKLNQINSVGEEERERGRWRGEEKEILHNYSKAGRNEGVF